MALFLLPARVVRATLVFFLGGKKFARAAFRNFYYFNKSCPGIRSVTVCLYSKKKKKEKKKKVHRTGLTLYSYARFLPFRRFRLTKAHHQGTSRTSGVWDPRRECRSAFEAGTSVAHPTSVSPLLREAKEPLLLVYSTAYTPPLRTFLCLAITKRVVCRFCGQTAFFSFFFPCTRRGSTSSERAFTSVLFHSSASWSSY